jgi:hypothetical protein
MTCESHGIEYVSGETVCGACWLEESNKEHRLSAEEQEEVDVALARREWQEDTWELGKGGTPHYHEEETEVMI